MSVKSLVRRISGALTWKLPRAFLYADRILDGYSLRCVVFHDIAEKENDFTRGLGVTMHPRDFERRLSFLRRHYKIVSLDDVIGSFSGHPLPELALLLTFDDGYRSVHDVALPLAKRYRIPFLVFVCPSLIDDATLSLDNLIAFIVNRGGLATLKAALPQHQRVANARDIFGRVFSKLDRQSADLLRRLFQELAPPDITIIARQLRLHLSATELNLIAAAGMEIGNHTAAHTFLRFLNERELMEEIGGSKERIKEITGVSTRAFSFPYGSRVDATPQVVKVLRATGHSIGFLVESEANTQSTDSLACCRVALRGKTDGESFFELEILPRFRKRWRRQTINE